MKKFLLFFCLCPVLYGSGQTLLTSGQSTAFDIRDMSGKPITTTPPEVNGSPLLSDNWGRGYVKFVNGRIIKDISLRFNLFNNELNYQLDNLEFAFIEPVSEFSFSYEEEGKSHKALFRNGYSGAKPAWAKLFFEVLVDGSRFQLLKRAYKSISESSGYGAVAVKSYKEASEIFIYDAQLTSLSLVKNKQPLGESVPELARALARLPTNENGKFRSEKELVGLFAKLNQ